jgi:signal transduction histidine kinase
MSIRDGALSLVGRWDDDRLTDGRVVTMARGTADDVWVGTRNGLNRLDLVTGAVERIPPNPSDPAALAAGCVTSLLLDSKARLWIGTLGGGIQVLAHRDSTGRPRFRRIGTAEGLPSANVKMLLQDTQGKIWASTDDGLAEVDSDTLAVRALRRADGVAFASYYGGSGARTPEGALLFGGDGLTVVRPERLKDWGFRPPVVVTDARIGGQPVLADRFNGAGSAEPLLITPKANSLAVEFSALDYTAPERNRYAYKLDGFDTNWVETDPTRRLAVYTNLPPGNYALHLRGSNRDGVWTEKTLQLPIQVLPAWYQTLWFKLALFAAGIAAVAVLVQARTAFLRQRQRELQGQVEARTAEVVHQKEVVEQQKAVVELRNIEVEQQRAVAEQAHRNIADAYRELGDTLLELQQTQAKLVQQEKLASLGQLVAGVAHEVNTPLGVALAASTQLADEVARLDGVIASGQLRRTNLTDFMATLHELSELLARNCARASSLIQSFKAVAADRGSDERRRFDLRAYVADVIKSVEPTLHRSPIKVLTQEGIEGAAPLTIDSYPGALSQVIINLIANALTHAFGPEHGGVITIQIALRDAAHAELIVRDDGKGIPPDILPKIFDPFFTTRRGAGGTGLGLHIVHNLVTGPLGGSISVETAPASGTAFIVVLPLNAPPEPL